MVVPLRATARVGLAADPSAAVRGIEEPAGSEIEAARAPMVEIVVSPDVEHGRGPRLLPGVHEVGRAVRCVARKMMVRGTGRDVSEPVDDLVQ